MRLFKKSIFVLLLTVSFFSGRAQQVGQFSQYFLNKSLLNPAAMGINSKVNVVLGYRSQWVGFEGAPQSYFVNGSFVIGENHRRLSYVDKSIRVSNPDLFKMQDSTSAIKHVVGGSMFGNNMGPMTATASYGSYAFHYPIHEFVVSAGASVGVSTLRLDFTTLEVQEQGDQNYLKFFDQNDNSAFVDMNLGVMVYSHNFYLGFSSTRLVPNKIKFDQDAISVDLNTHHYISTGMKIDLTNELVLKPSLLVRFLSSAPASYDFNVLLDFHHLVYGGISYRHQDAVAGIIGLLLNDHYNISYAFDATTSGLNTVTTGTHEIMLGVRL